MIRKIAMAVLLVITVFAQCSLFQMFEIASIRPNLLLIVVASFGLMRGRTSGMLCGFFGGMCIDLFFPGQIGMHALIYMWIGYLSGFLYRIFYDDDIKTPVLMISVMNLVYGCYLYVFTFLLRGRIHFLFYFRRIIIPETLYTVIVTILIYRFLYRFNRLLGKTDKRSVDSMV